MRIATFATSRSGGAGHAAARIVSGLQDLGEEAFWLDPKKEGLVGSVGAQLQDYALGTIREGRSNTLFTTSWPQRFDRDDPAVDSADVYHLHWVNRFLSPADIAFLANKGKPIVWTLHDQRPFTGGCHFSDTCENYRNLCVKCPQLNRNAHWIAEKTQTELLETLGKLEICFVGPSEWITNDVRSSRLFSETNHTALCIPPGIELDAFRPSGDARRRIRGGLGIDEDRLVIVTGAHSLTEHRKGFDLVRRALKEFSERATSEEVERILLVTYGHGKVGDTGLEEIALGTVSAEAVIGLLQASDLYFLMTRQDVGPTVILEAISCGLPVLAPDVGGVPEMVESGVNGWTVPYEDYVAAADVLRSFSQTSATEREAMSAASRQKADNEFGNEKQALAYQDLFRQLIENRGSKQLATPEYPTGEIPKESRFLVKKALFDFRFYLRSSIYFASRMKNRLRLSLTPIWPVKEDPKAVRREVVENESRRKTHETS